MNSAGVGEDVMNGDNDSDPAGGSAELKEAAVWNGAQLTPESREPKIISNLETEDEEPAKQGCCARQQKGGGKKPKKSVPLTALFRYSTPCERVRPLPVRVCLNS